MSIAEILAHINREDRRVPEAVGLAIPSIERLVAAVADRMLSGGRLFYIGAGTSGRLGVVDASECPPTYGVPPGLVVGIIAGGEDAMFRAVEFAEDSREDGWRDLCRHDVSDRDAVVGIAASGTTPYVHGALRHARHRGATTAMIACTALPAAILDAIDIPIVIVVGPEVVTGSTRMKSGTATKLALNIISTGAMIRVGKTFGNLMVDLRATNAKLVDRSERIVAEVCGVARADARALLARADGMVKRAIAMHVLGVDAGAADVALAQASGVIRRAVSAEPPPVSEGEA
jgi:N-acetylmuramic acid 6-phosphate etherase